MTESSMTLWRHWIAGQFDASLAAALLLATAVLFRHRLSPAVRSALLLIALIRLALPPWIRAPWSEALVDVPPIDNARSWAATTLQSDIALYAAVLTTAVSLVLLVRLAFAFARGDRYWIARTAPAPRWVQELTARLAAGAEAPAGTTGIEVRLAAADGPMAVGLRRRLIVLPADVLDRLDRQALEAVLAHEIGHHLRRDLVWMAAASALTAVAWFNPLAHLLARALVAAREDGSDDWAVSRTSEDPLAYAHAVLRSARVISAGSPLGAAGAHPMGGRLRRLLDARTRRERRLGLAGAAALLLIAAAAIPGAHLPVPDRDDDRVVIVIRR